MDEVADLLTAWGIPDLIPTFAKHGITVQCLSALTIDEIKELVPLIGPQALFVRSWKVWLKAFHDENVAICQNLEEVDTSSCNISLSALQDINILQEKETQTTTPEKTNSPNKTLCSPKKVTDPNKAATDNVELIQLLKENFEATSLIQYVGESLPNENARNLLALYLGQQYHLHAIRLAYEVEEPQNQKIFVKLQSDLESPVPCNIMLIQKII